MHSHSFTHFVIPSTDLFLITFSLGWGERGERGGSAGKYFNAWTQLLMHSTGVVLMHNDYAGSMASGKWNRKHQQANYGSVFPISRNMQISNKFTCIYHVIYTIYIKYYISHQLKMKAKPIAIAGTLFSLIAFRILLMRKWGKTKWDRASMWERERECVKCVNNRQREGKREGTLCLFTCILAIRADCCLIMAFISFDILC